MSTSSGGTSDAKRLMREADRWTRTVLLERWTDIKEGREIQDWPDGKAFEYLVIRAFNIEQTRVRWPFQVTYPHKYGVMEQIDGIIYLESRSV